MRKERGGWQVHSSRVAYANPWIRIRADQVTTPLGKPGEYGVVEVVHPAVFVVAITDADEVVMVKLYRYSHDAESWEIPAGGSDGEDLLVAAQRELREETGLAATEWTNLGRLFALNGVANAPEHVFLARGLSKTSGAELEEEGICEVARIPWPHVLRLIAQGEITDSETVAALMLAALALGRVS